MGPDPDEPPRVLVAAMAAARHETPGAALGVVDLAELFVGPGRMHRLKSDAAEELFERTRGEPLAVALELDDWVERGLVTWTGRGFAVGAVH